LQAEYHATTRLNFTLAGPPLCMVDELLVYHATGHLPRKDGAQRVVQLRGVVAWYTASSYLRVYNSAFYMTWDFGGDQ